MELLLGNILVTVASFLWAVELIPQIIKTLRLKTVGDISIWWVLPCFIAYIIYEIAMILHGNWVYFFVTLMPTILSGYFLYLVFRYREKRILKMPYWKCGRCHHEWEYPEKLECDWCGFTNPLLLEKETPFEKFCYKIGDFIENYRNSRNKKTR